MIKKIIIEQKDYPQIFSKINKVNFVNILREKIIIEVEINE